MLNLKTEKYKIKTKYSRTNNSSPQLDSNIVYKHANSPAFFSFCLLILKFEKKINLKWKMLRFRVLKAKYKHCQTK